MLLIERSALLVASGTPLGEAQDELLVVFPRADFPDVLHDHGFVGARLQDGQLTLSLRKAIFPKALMKDCLANVAADALPPEWPAHEVDVILMQLTDEAQQALQEAGRFWVCSLDEAGQVVQAQCFGTPHPEHGRAQPQAVVMPGA